MNVLGISAYYHDSAAALVVDGRISSATQEERFTRIKNDSSFPQRSVDYCLKSAKLKISDIDLVCFYDKPFLKFERLLHTYLEYAPRGFLSYFKAMSTWLTKKVWIKDSILSKLKYSGEILFPEHHYSHAASAFYPSPFERAAFITIDGVGEWTTTSYGIGVGTDLKIDSEIHFPHSLGLLYSAFTSYTGFKVNSGEYKLMGLAPYGNPIYKDRILSNLIDLHDDGSFRLNMEYFNYCVGLTMTNSSFHTLFEGPPREVESDITQKEMDIAASVQKVIEEAVLRIVRHTKARTGEKNLVLAGGVALNCVANGKIMKEGIFDRIWIQPAAGDAGGALGAALIGSYRKCLESRHLQDDEDLQLGSFLGPEYSESEISDFLKSNNIPSVYYTNFQDLTKCVASLIDSSNVVGWFQGRMEFGPRALGARSILGDARRPEMQEIMNLKIKYRESFRPFAPSVLNGDVNDYFDIDANSPYMLICAAIKDNIKREMTSSEKELLGLDQLKVVRSSIPAVTHVDYSARIQTVDKKWNSRYFELLKSFFDLTGCSVLINTSFNVRGEPIVCSPYDAYRCFMKTEMDYLVIGNHLIAKKDQCQNTANSDSKIKFELD